MSGLNVDKLITPNELAEFLQISKSSVYLLAETRKIPFCKIGGSLRFRKNDIDEYIQKSTFEPLK